MMQKNYKKDLIIALKAALINAEKFEDGDRILVVITQYKTEEKIYKTDFHVVR